MANFRKIFSQNYDKYIDKIYRFIFLKVSSQEVAEDLTSEVFLRFWEKLNTKIKIENIQAFLYQIARNLVVDHYREKGRAQLVSVDYCQVPDQGVGLEEKAIIGSDIDRIKVILAKINDDYREMIVWYYLDELSVPEIAQITEKSEEAVRVTIHRALNALKSELKV